MGYLNALAIAASPLSLADKLEFHRIDFDKQLPDSLIGLWHQAILLYDAGIAETTELELPSNIRYRGTTKSTIAQIITEYNLEFFTLAFAADVPASPLDVPLQCEQSRVGAKG